MVVLSFSFMELKQLFIFNNRKLRRFLLGFRTVADACADVDLKWSCGCFELETRGWFSDCS